MLIARRGKVVYRERAGEQAPGVPLSDDSRFRIYSMTKPIATCALMTLYEQGKFNLEDPVHFFLGEKWRKENMKVFTSGTVEEHTTAASFPPGSGETDMGVCRSAALRAGMSSPYARGGRLATTRLSASANTIPAGQLTLLKGAKASTPGVGLSAAAGCSCSLPSLEGVVRKGVC